MSSIELIVDGVTVFDTSTSCEEASDEPTGSTLPSHTEPSLPDDAVVLAQVRREVTSVYFQAKFADGSRQSVFLENVNVNGLEDTFEGTDKSPRLSLAGTGNHFYTPVTIVGLHVYADNIHIGDLPVGWDDGRKAS